MANFEQMMRVDHAGEHGAVRIYEGQRAVFKSLPHKQHMVDLVTHMAEQEQSHLDGFNDLLVTRGIRPTLVSPVWHAAGFALGAATALMGEKAAMACTATVEEVIDAHYAEQLEALEGDTDNQPVADMIARFRADEAEHRDTALAHGAADTPGYRLMRRFIQAGCKVAIAVSERV